MLKEFTAQLREVGNSIVITIPKPILELYHLTEKNFVTCAITEKDSLICEVLKEVGKK